MRFSTALDKWWRPDEWETGALGAGMEIPHFWSWLIVTWRLVIVLDTIMRNSTCSWRILKTTMNTSIRVEAKSDKSSHADVWTVEPRLLTWSKKAFRVSWKRAGVGKGAAFRDQRLKSNWWSKWQIIGLFQAFGNLDFRYLDREDGGQLVQGKDLYPILKWLK